LTNFSKQHRPISHCFCSAPTCHGQAYGGKGGQTELVYQKAALCTKVHQPPKPQAEYSMSHSALCADTPI